MIFEGLWLAYKKILKRFNESAYQHWTNIELNEIINKTNEETKLNQHIIREHSLFNLYTNDNWVKEELLAGMLDETLY